MVRKLEPTHKGLLIFRKGLLSIPHLNLFNKLFELLPILQVIQSPLELPNFAQRLKSGQLID
jgi:hypothetical protein